MLVVWWRSKLRAFAELDLIVLFLTLVLPFLSAVVLKAVGWQISQFNNPGQITLSMVWQGLVGAGRAVRRQRGDRLPLAAGALVGRGRRLLGHRAALLHHLPDQRPGHRHRADRVAGLLDRPAGGDARRPAVVLLLPDRAAVRVPAADSQLRRHLLLAADAAVLARVGYHGLLEQSEATPPKRHPSRRATPAYTPPISVQALFEAFIVFWPLATWVVFTYVGEKMAWHTVYFATSMAPLAGWWLGRVIDGINWKTARSQGIFWLMAMVPLFLIALRAILPTSTRRPFRGCDVTGLSTTVQWVLALIFALVLIYFIYDRIVALGWRAEPARDCVSPGRRAGCRDGGRLLPLQLHQLRLCDRADGVCARHARYQAGAGADWRRSRARRRATIRSRVAYDDDSTWPLEWYLRDYPNKVYYRREPQPRHHGFAGGDRRRQESLQGEAISGRPLPRVQLPADLVAQETYKGLTWSAYATASRIP